MATLALAAVGSAIGGALLPSGLGVLGATLSGAALGSQAGALAGSFIDQALFGASGRTRRVEGPRLSDLQVVASTEGAAIPRIYGRVRIGGQIIWAADIEEQAVTRKAQGSGKGGAGGGGAAAKGATTYSYFASFAVALAEGEISAIGRVWANGSEIDLGQVSHRLYTGSRDQQPDSLIAAHVGADAAPAYRDTAYIVFERLALAAYGNRIPQLSFEVYRSVEPFAEAIRSVVLIPGSGEFVYSVEPVTVAAGLGASASENVHTLLGGTDWTVSLDQLSTALPNATSVSLIVSWFGTDLRAGHCQLRPGVERREKTTSPLTWGVAGATRETAHLVSQRDGRPAYGGTPSDASVIAAIRDLKSRGLSVTLTPFLLMDIPADTALADPYGGAVQPAYPWRGRITVDPAPGRPSSPDKSPAAASQLAGFIGTAAVSDFAIAGETIVYSGPDEWSYRRMVLHQACLAKAAGGVDAFLIGTELRGLTTVRSSSTAFPFVDALVALAADVKAILGASTKVTYAADWSEYFGHQPPDGSGDLLFHLDPLWASPSIDAVGIDVYWPLADWRDGRAHADYLAGHRQVHDLAYLKGNVAGGEGFDWYYASDADREAQVRTPISDGLGKPWVFRFKDVRSWWLNAHHNRIGGAEVALPTAWVPQSKPFWFMEIGCGAVDKAANQPNVFVDPKSSENALPYFSRGVRDDLMQRRYLQAMIEAFDPAAPGYDGANPVSALTGQRMVDLDRIHVYAWDARPFPAFPHSADVWGDAANWRLGHWLNGRFASVPVADMIGAILADYGFDRFDAAGVVGTAAGYLIDRPMSARDALQPFELAFFIDTVESGGKVAFRQRGAEAAAVVLAESDLVETEPGSPLLTLTRAQETDLPGAAKLRYVAAAGDYRQAVVESRRLTGASARLSQADIAIALDEDQAAEMADAWLFETWAARERSRFSVPPSLMAIEPGDPIVIETQAGPKLYRVSEIGDHGARDIEALSFDPEVYGRTVQPERPAAASAVVTYGQPALFFLDLPQLTGSEPLSGGYAAATQTPWAGGVAIFSSPEDTGFQLQAVAERQATIGVTRDPLAVGPVSRFDRANVLTVTLASGTLQSASQLQVFAGGNALAVKTPGGLWEVLQFLDAELVSASTYRLSGLLRGQAGTEFDMAPLPAGSTIVLLDGALARIDLAAAEARLPLRWRYGPANRPIGDASYVTTRHAFRGLALRPFSPVHVTGRRNSAGDLDITWVRRTRIGGDSWDDRDVSLGEDSERYEVDILDGDRVVRSLSSTSPTATYTAAEQAADFGAVSARVFLRVAQVSAVYGRGVASPANL